jgi:GrpB-like predicted nucleotidyltransferase (UPF0157 family)
MSKDGAKQTGLNGGPEKGTITITIANYDPLWPEAFRTHANAIGKALRDVAQRIEHIGSTSVPGLAAKPIIDILVVVADSADEASYLPQMVTAGYELRVREPEFHEHRMFKTPARNVHIHFFSADSPEVERLLTFRDWLRQSSGARQLYEKTKRQLAAQSWADSNDYAAAKTDVIERLIAAARRGDETAH